MRAGGAGQVKTRESSSCWVECLRWFEPGFGLPPSLVQNRDDKDRRGYRGDVSNASSVGDMTQHGRRGGVMKRRNRVEEESKMSETIKREKLVQGTHIHPRELPTEHETRWLRRIVVESEGSRWVGKLPGREFRQKEESGQKLPAG
jgi:hypothetical protein